MKTKANTEMKLQYRKWLETGLMMSLMFCVLLFQGFKRFTPNENSAKPDLGGPLTGVDLPENTRQDNKKEPVRPPAVPFQSDDPEFIDDGPVFELPEWDADFKVPEFVEEPDDPYAFVLVEQEPSPVGGYAAIAAHLVYPELAQRVGIEGRVTIRVKIGEQGSVVKMLVQQPLFPSCDESAMRAIEAVKWNPATQRDRPVTVWMSVPVDFRLR
ncbi:energy transducer TonB [bacterium]|nr:energy transducer TonB [bacterium]